MCNPILAAIRHPGISSTVHTAGVAFGLSARLLSSARIFEVVRLTGAVLIALGLRVAFSER
jgi:threonine/homoserine/homoserine lactone efflux protein